MAYLPKLSTLVLDTRDLSDNDVNSDKNSFVFRNIDFDILLGEEWRTYDSFNMMLVSSVMDQADSVPDVTVPEIRLSGLPFIDSDMRVSESTQEISLCTLDCNNLDSAPYIQYYSGGLTWTFSRADRGKMNFYIRVVDPSTNQLADATFSHQQYIFKIYHL